MSKVSDMNFMSFQDYISHAVNQLGQSRTEAKVQWLNQNNRGKYLICEARGDCAERLFVRRVMDPYTDLINDRGWYDTFTLSDRPVSQGLWIVEIKYYRIDRNEYLNVRVHPLCKVDSVRFVEAFSLLRGAPATWESPAWWLMVSCSGLFAEGYQATLKSRRVPNYKALQTLFPELEGKSLNETGAFLLRKYIAGEVTADAIEKCLYTPTEWELMLVEVVKAVITGDVQKYSGRYPLFASKISGVGMLGQRSSSNAEVLERVQEYLSKQYSYYKKLVELGELCAVDDLLSGVEAALVYRKQLSDEEKAKKKVLKKLNKENRSAKND